MKRFILDEIERWNERKEKKPLILMGARQVGKTWLMNEFAGKHYRDNVVAVNFMENDFLRDALENCNLDPGSVIQVIETVTSKKIIAGRTLLMLDELQESPRMLTALKFFNEKMPELSIIAAGSLLGLAVNRNRRGTRKEEKRRVSFPVGKVDFLDVPPMTFNEFLLAIGEVGKYELIRSGDWSVISGFAESFSGLVRTYGFVGGMPAAVETYATTHNFSDVRSVQKELLTAYDADFAKHANGALLQKIRLLWRSLPGQLAKENKKFIYTALKEGARAREYEEALEWLDDAGMIHIVNRVSHPGMPLASYAEFGAFKLYAHDVGLLGGMSDLPAKCVIDGNSVFTNFKGALAEQYVLEELVACRKRLYYWSPDDTRAEVEFLMQDENGICPIEVKAEKNLKAKSLKVFCERYSPGRALRFSLAHRSHGEKIDDYPLYAVERSIKDIVL